MNNINATEELSGVDMKAWKKHKAHLFAEILKHTKIIGFDHSKDPVYRIQKSDLVEIFREE